MKKIPIKKQIKQEDLKKIRRFFHLKMNNSICPVLKMKFPEEDMVVDHVHKSNANNLNREFEAGLIRGVIHRQANTMEGKITNSFIRCGLHKFDITLQDFLRNLADFIENPTMTHLKYIHPKEAPKGKFLKKTSIIKLIKLYKLKYPSRKIPEVLIYKKYKKGKKKGKERGKKLTKGLERLYKEFNLEPEFYK